MALMRGNTVKMQATIGCLSRIVSRTLVNGVVNSKSECNAAATGQTSASSCTSEKARLLTAVSGFPKQKSGYNIDNILKGQIGDDAYFIARHIDDWNVNNNNIIKESNADPSSSRESETVEQLLNPTTPSSMSTSRLVRIRRRHHDIVKSLKSKK